MPAARLGVDELTTRSISIFDMAANRLVRGRYFLLPWDLGESISFNRFLKYTKNPLQLLLYMSGRCSATGRHIDSTASIACDVADAADAVGSVDRATDNTVFPLRSFIVRG